MSLRFHSLLLPLLALCLATNALAQEDELAASFARRVQRATSEIEKFYGKPIVDTVLFSACARSMAHWRIADQRTQQRFTGALADLRHPARSDVQRLVASIDANKLRSWEKNELVDLCLAGIATGLGSANQYYSVEDMRLIVRRNSGELGDVALDFEAQGDALVITELMPDAPAYGAGLRVGDSLIDIDGRAAATHDQASFRSLLIGAAGTQVSLTARREGVTAPIVATVTRAVRTEPAATAQRLADNIILLTIPGIGENALNDIARALKEQDRQAGAPRGLVVDLRSNAGGALPYVVGVAATLMDRDTVIGELHPLNKATHFALSVPLIFGSRPALAAPLDEIPAWARQVPLVVLTSEMTAGGGTLIAAALQDKRHAVLIGENTSTRAFMRNWIDVGDGGRLRLVSGYLFSASGKPLDGVGVAPEIQVAATVGGTAADGPDQLVAKALRVLRPHGEPKAATAPERDRR